jgi:hypothetical protein
MIQTNVQFIQLNKTLIFHIFYLSEFFRIYSFFYNFYSNKVKILFNYVLLVFNYEFSVHIKMLN